jgi:hypothetical protein
MNGGESKRVKMMTKVIVKSIVYLFVVREKHRRMADIFRSSSEQAA